jgi:hypothetical protein
VPHRFFPGNLSRSCQKIMRLRNTDFFFFCHEEMNEETLFDLYLGVAELCNKMNGPYFTTYDEEMATAFRSSQLTIIQHTFIQRFKTFPL